MRTDLTDITMVIDRSGSMESICTDAEGGINTFVDSQKSEPGEALLTLVQFDTAYEFVHKGVPIGSVPRFKLVPRGSTALLDAVGHLFCLEHGCGVLNKCCAVVIQIHIGRCHDHCEGARLIAAGLEC